MRNRPRRARALVLGLLATGLVGILGAQEPPLSPDRVLAEVRIDQKLGESVPGELEFRDAAGASVRLDRYFGERPVVLVLVYYECPMLCNLVLNSLVQSLATIDLQAGEDYELVAASIDPGETPELASAKRNAYLDLYGDAGSEQGWHFLTGSAPAIDALADAVGFRYVYDAETDEYAHGAAVFLLTPEGVLARYLFGIDYPARDLRLAIVEASDGKVGNLVDAVLLRCYRYDPQTGRYGQAVFTTLRVAAVLTLLGMGGLIFTLLRQERRRNAARAAGGAES